MKYGIITLPDSDRIEYKARIRENIHYPEETLDAFDARVNDPIKGCEERRLKFSAELWGNAKRGEVGIWLSNFDRWQQAAECGPLIVFEDDAIIHDDFTDRFEDFMAEVPDDWDFAALWVPENQRQDYLYNIIYNTKSWEPQFLGFTTAEKSIYRIPGATYAALAYQGYGMVALVYSQNGGKRLVERARATGMYGPVDCWIYEQAKMGFLKGFAPRPECADIVHYDWAAESHVQLTERAL